MVWRSALIIVIRILWHIALFWPPLHPFIVVTVGRTLDGLDDDIYVADGWFERPLGEEEGYQRLDKALDGVGLLFITIWLAVSIRKVWWAWFLLPFAVWRLLGDILFITSHNELAILVVFPDVIILLFSAFTFLDFFQHRTWKFSGPRRVPFVLLIFTLYGIVREINQHIVNFDPSGIINKTAAALFVLYATWRTSIPPRQKPVTHKPKIKKSELSFLYEGRHYF